MSVVSLETRYELGNEGGGTLRGRRRHLTSYHAVAASLGALELHRVPDAECRQVLVQRDRPAAARAHADTVRLAGAPGKENSDRDVYAVQ